MKFLYPFFFIILLVACTGVKTGILATSEPNDRHATMRLSVSSDPHWGSKIGNPSARASIIRRLAQENPKIDAFILLGDITDFGGAWWQAREAFQELDAGLGGIPLITIPGNHDLWLGGLAHFRNYFRNPRGAGDDSSAPFFSLDIGVSILVFLDIPSGSETFTFAQKSWLVGVLSSAKSSGRPVIVFSHSFFYASGYRNSFSGKKWYDDKKNLAALEPLFREYGVKLVISGHNHYLELLESGGVSYAIVGAMGGRLDPVPTYVSPASLWFEQGTHGSLELEISDGRISMRFVDPLGSVLKEHSILF